MTVLEAEYDPGLIEAAVLLAPRDREVERTFHRERDRLYEIGDPEARDAAFTAFHARWLQRLGLDEPLRETLAEHPAIVARCGRCIVVRALGARDEYADLLVAPPAAPTVLVRLTPGTLSVRDRALEFLRRELFHVADMLDPEFGYEPGLGPTESALQRRRWDRYRVLWDTLIDGRLARLGRAAPGAHADRWRDFRRAFPELGNGDDAAFERFWGAARCTHADLVAFAAGAWLASQPCEMPTGVPPPGPPSPAGPPSLARAPGASSSTAPRREREGETALSPGRPSRRWS